MTNKGYIEPGIGWLVIVQFVRALNAVRLATFKHRRKEGHNSVTVIRLAHTMLDDLRGRGAATEMSPIATLMSATT